MLYIFPSKFYRIASIAALIGASVLSAVAVDSPLSISWSNKVLRIDDARPDGRTITVDYLEAYCRGNSHTSPWDQTVIPHASTLVSQTSQRIELRDVLSGGVTVDHVITCAGDQVSFDLTAHNPTTTEAEVQWAQPCIHVANFLGVPEVQSSETYLTKCFVFIEGQLTRLPFDPWSKDGILFPGQAWCPPGVPRTDINPRPLSTLITSNGLIGCYSHNDKMIMATAWEPYQEIFQGIFVCLHSDFRVGGLHPGETKRIRGAIYLMNADVPSLLQRYQAEFPSGTLTTPMQAPFSGTPTPIPGTIKVSQYDKGGEGRAYHDAEASNLKSGSYRPGEGIDADGIGIDSIKADEWIEYTVTVSTAGNYTLTIPMSNAGTGGSFHINFDGINKTGSLNVPATGSWTSFQNAIATVNLKAGQQVMQIIWDSSGSTGSVCGLRDISIASGGNAGVIGNGTGLSGQYFDNADFSGAALTRTDATVDFDWGMGAPAGSMGVDTFSARWTGQVQAQHSETYAFHVTGDDGVRLWINGTQLIDKWIVQAPTEYSATIALAAGAKYDIKLEYFENVGGAVAQLRWSSASTPKSIIPTSQLYPASVVAPPSQTPYAGAPIAIPGTIKVCEYDTGGEGVAYHDIQSANLKSSSYRPGEGVDADGGEVGWVFAGEWIEYTVNVSTAGNYTFTIPMSNAGTGGTFHLGFDGVNKTGTLNVPATGNWATFQNVTSTVNLNAGTQVMLISWDSNGSTNSVCGLHDISVAPANTGGGTLGNGTGLSGQYFDNADFTGAALTRTDATVNFDWGMGAPAGSMGVDFFSVRWTGQVQAQHSQAYTFHVTGDDGVRLWINGTLLIDKWIAQAPTEYAANMNLTAGAKYDIKLEYFENFGGAVAQLRWSSASTPKTVIPTSQLYPTSTPIVRNPYSGTPMAIPGTIKVSEYDKGGEGIAYHDKEASNLKMSTYRPGEGVDADGGEVGWVFAGEWIEYTVNVASAGDYIINIPMSNAGTGGTFHLNFDGANKTGTLNVPATGGWATFQNTSASVNLNAGMQVMRISWDTNGSTGSICGLHDITLQFVPSGNG